LRAELEEKLNYQKSSLACMLITAHLGFYSACTGDTWASELGVLAKSAPFSVITFRTVPPGTNGGVTVFGTLMSGVGGLFVGGVWLFFQTQYQILFLCAFAGLFGSFIDSILGATVQYSGMNEKTKKVVEAPGKDVKHISGVDLLSNNSVNFVASALTAVMCASLCPYLF